MKSTTVVASFFGSLAFATPVMEEKRYLVTSFVLETATETVTASRGWVNWPWGRPATTASISASFTPTESSTSILPLTNPSIVSTSTAASTTPVTSASIEPSSTLSPAEPTTTQGSGSVSTYADPILKHHNLHRQNHSADDLVWDTNLANITAEIAASCVYAHNTEAGGGGYGQNIGAGAPENKIDGMITNQMYNDEMMLYPGYGGEPSMGSFEKWGHFSQIVWKETRRVGCFTQHCPGGLKGVNDNVLPYLTVCNYQPIGNMGSQYAANVIRPRGDAIVIV